MRMHRGVGAAAIAFLISGPARAQAAAIPPVSDAPAARCELHVWPSRGLRSVYYGWLHGGINDGAVKGQAGYPQVDAARLGTATQAKLAEAAQPAKTLGRPDYSVIVHDSAPGTQAIRAATGRISDSTTSCYSELLVEDVFFQQAVFSGSFLKTLFRFRDFGASQTPTRVFGSWVETRLLHVPPKTSSDIEAAGKELETAYQANFALFGAALNKPPKAKK